MTVGEYCNREVVITAAGTSITETAQLMRDYHVGTIVVVEKQGDANLPVGIVTDRDLVLGVLAQQVPVDSVTVDDVMSRDLVMVDEEQGLLDTLQTMVKSGVRRVPVINTQGSLQGILAADDAIELIAESMGDLAHLIRNELLHEMKNRP